MGTYAIARVASIVLASRRQHPHSTGAACVAAGVGAGAATGVVAAPGVANAPGWVFAGTTRDVDN